MNEPSHVQAPDTNRRHCCEITPKTYDHNFISNVSYCCVSPS